MGALKRKPNELAKGQTQGTFGVDTGGTFTDLVWVQGEEVRTAKVPSTPGDPGLAIERGLRQLKSTGQGEQFGHIVHGTTVALNALLTGRVARTALVTNQGFRDLIEIGRQDRPDLYALHPEKTEALVSRDLRFEVGQRSWPQHTEQLGPVEVREVARPSDKELATLRAAIAKKKPQTIAICLLHSYADPEPEQRIAKALAALNLPVTSSAQIMAEYREFERFSTAVVNAALVPLMRDYLGGLEARLDAERLELMQSNGGTLLASDAAEEPARVLLSGPAGGVVGASQAAQIAGFNRIVGLDMGGTSTDVAFHDNAHGSAVRDEPVKIAGHPIGVPSLDIHTVGTGGGSLAHLDNSGVLHVGPMSAGADPGPVCYGKSDQLTVTDAHVFLGHIAQGEFVAGDLQLDTDRVARAFERLAKSVSSSKEQAASAILDVARAAMRRAVGVMTMQRGEDPKQLPLVAFGGAGGLHGAALAKGLGMLGCLVPAHPGVLSALGMARAEALREDSITLLEPWGQRPFTELKRSAKDMANALRKQLREEGHSARSIQVETELDLCYQGQSYELRVALSARSPEEFHAKHEELYGYRLDRPIIAVNLRSRARAIRPLSEAPKARKRACPKSAILGTRQAHFESWTDCPIIDRSQLKPGHHFEGPALVEEFSGTTIVPPAASVQVLAGSALWIE